MIEDRAVEAVHHTGQAARSETVGMAGPRVAARMIVPEDDPGASATRCIGDDRSNRQRRFGLSALVTSQEDAVQLLVDMCDEQKLTIRIGFGEAACEKAAGSCGSLELQWSFGTLMAHELKLCRAVTFDDSNRVRLRRDFIHNGCVPQACAAPSAD